MSDYVPEIPSGSRSFPVSSLPQASFGNPAQLNPVAPQPLSSVSSYADLQYLFGVQDPAVLVPPKPNRNRRKASQGSEHTKHRRTRSGCYTCRSRRVKCDESRPVCERCKKGGRDCVYPEATTSSKAAAGTASKATVTAKQGSPSSSDAETEERDGSPRLDVIPDEDEHYDHSIQDQSAWDLAGHGENATQLAGQDDNVSKRSETPPLIHDKGASPTPSTEGSVGYSASQTKMTNSTGSSRRRMSLMSMENTVRPNWAHLPYDLQYYLQYFCENITLFHYSLKSDTQDFLRTRFLDTALRQEALLYAVVGFSAFQRTLRNPSGKIQDFLQYYNKAVSLLLQSLKKGQKHDNGTILAILQLATIEEFLGDWINLLGHQKAAYQILTELYTPKTVMEHEESRIILGWYMRFDVFAGLMGGFETVLSREWFSSAQDFFIQKVVDEPDQLGWKIEFAIAQNRLNAMDLSILFAKAGKGEISPEEFMRENEQLARRFQDWDTEMDPALKDPRYLVTDFTGVRPLESDDIVNPYMPNVMYTGPLFVMNVARIDWYSIVLMHKYQTALSTKQTPDAILLEYAYKTCQLFEAVEYYPESPSGCVLACQASLAIASLFLPMDEKHSMWARRKLATIESHGYIYPYTFRTKMADLFRDRSCMHWWLPNDERYPPIVRSIRKLVEERTAPAKDLPAEDLRDMKAIFAAMKLEDGQPTVTAGDVTDTGVAVTTVDDSYLAHVPAEGRERTGLADTNTYTLGFGNEHGFWYEGRDAGA